MTNEFKGFEYNILGCPIRLKDGESDFETARLAVEMVNKEIESLKLKSPNLSNTDIAVLTALKLASDKVHVDDEFKTSLLTLSLKHHQRQFN
jgi:cell division protein ZapA (FtsZ GTPase activity inhibitor)